MNVWPPAVSPGATNSESWWCIMTSLDTVRKTFTDWAPYYDATHLWIPYRRESRLALGIQRGDRVLDLACGTGANLAHLRELVGDEGRVVGVDLTPAMLDVARKRIARHGWKHVEVYEADAAQLPFADGSFDKAICAFALNIIPDYKRAIAEVERVLVPGGRFVVLDLRAGHNVSEHRSKRSLVLRAMRICAIDPTHQAIDELRRVFATVQVREHWAGLAYVAVTTKA